MSVDLEKLRPNAFAIAYRMLGSVSEAEDVVQEGLIRLHSALGREERIASPAAYLTTIVTRLAIDQLRSARARRERYVGEWLPEPLETTRTTDPETRVELAESLHFAFLILLESLTPEQRAVFLLRDVFDYGYEEIARIVGKSEAACRQIAVRARARVLERRPRFDAPPQQRHALADRFFGAIQKGDLSALEQLLAKDVSLHGDGGGKAPALARPLHGPTSVAKALLAWARAGLRSGGFVIRRTEVNGQPAAVLVTTDGAVFGVMLVDITDGQVAAVRAVVNPDKLRHMGTVENLGDYLRRAERTEKE